MYCIVNIRQSAMHGKSRFSGKTAVRGRDLLAGRGFRGRDFSFLGGMSRLRNRTAPKRLVIVVAEVRLAK